MHVDVAVLGSGFGGSLCALIADRIGLDVVLIDRATHPRFTIGESSTPTADLILRDLCDRYDLPRLKPLATWGSWQRTYPDVLGGMKRGFSYIRHCEGEAFEPDAQHRNELLVAASASDAASDTQWYRADVDGFFAREVRRAEIPFFEGTDTEPVQAPGCWHLSGADVTADFLIDATGSGRALARVVELGQRHLQTGTRAVFSHFVGVPRWRDWVERRGAAVADYPFDPDWSALHHVVRGGWLWMLRFKNDLVSAGWVLDVDAYPFDPSQPARSEWAALLTRYPTLDDIFSEAQLAPAPGALIRTGRLQRCVSRAAGPNWAMLPHAAGFVDPLHSTGIGHTMAAIERLMSILEENRGHLEERLEAYQEELLNEISFIDALVRPCYLSTDSFARWTASTMLYFAAATSYERMRAKGKEQDRSFLLADDERLADIAQEAARRAGGDSDGYEAWLEQALAPYNHVGLFHPPIPNMYERTAARKVS